MTQSASSPTHGEEQLPEESRARGSHSSVRGQLGRWRTGVRRGERTVRLAGDRAEAWSGRSALWLEMVKVRLVPSGILSGHATTEPEDGGWGFLWQPALLGFIAIVAVALGASLPSSPFKLEMPGTWFFGEPVGTSSTAGTIQTSQSYLLFGLVVVYGGLVLLMRAWFGLTRALARRPGAPIKYMALILVLWTLPLLVVPPLFSRDVFSYAAQGEMMSHHINPYLYGPNTLGAGPYVNPVDPLWTNTPAPYGPLFLMIDGFFASASFHNAFGTVILLRLLEVVGVAIIAFCIPKLARAYGRDPAEIFSLAVLNPLVGLTLVAGAHNDAIMVGLLVAGITAAKYKHPVWGVVLCTLAAAIKVPAALGIVYVAWDWMGTGVPWRQRVRPVINAALISGAIMLGLSIVSGLGMGWIANLATPGTVRSWLAPATGAGMALSGLAHVVGVPVSLGGMLSVTRVLGLFAAAAIAVYLWTQSDRIGSLRALGISLLLFVILGPVVQPWYLTWGIILLVPIATGRLRSLLVAMSVVSPFIGLPGGRTLLDELIHSNPLAVAAALLVLLGVFLVPIGRWATARHEVAVTAEGDDRQDRQDLAEGALSS